MPLPDAPRRRVLHARMQVSAAHLRLPFRSRAWRGPAGNWLGAGIGSSIDFQDHRPYVPGDDPRYIDWQAYARTGHYTMKLYREEVSPLVDLVLDGSGSMFFDSAKAERVFELLYFCVESALQSGASVRCFVRRDNELAAWPLEALLGHGEIEALVFRAGSGAAAWRQGSMRVFISDLLWGGAPGPWLTAMSSGKGRGLLLAPFCKAESEPDWSGNVEFADCETAGRRVQHVSPDLLTRYRQTYARHFDLWKEEARRHTVLIARVPSGADFHEALRAEALPAGAVELA